MELIIKRSKQLTISFLFLVGLIIAWQIFISVYDSVLIPSTFGTINAAIELSLDMETWRSFVVSNQSLVIGFVLSSVFGVSLGILISRYKWLERALDPWLDFLLVIPIAMIMPFVILTMGFSLASRCIIVCLFTFPIVVINTRAGLRQVAAELLDMAQVFGANERDIWTKILFKSAAPMIWSGLRAGMARAISGMVLSELLLISVGIGTMFQTFQGEFNPEKTFGLVAILVAESLLILKVMALFERRSIPWFYTGRNN